MTNVKRPVATLEGLLGEALAGSKTYEAYREEMNRQVKNGATSGLVQSEALINYTKLNDRRMRRWERTFKIPEHDHAELEALEGDLTWLVLTESWCGDAAPVLPVMHAIAEASPGIRLRIADRDDHPELMARYKTDGAMSIPKLLMLDAHEKQVLAHWGPRPEEPMKMTRNYKAEYGKLSPEFREELQRWYNADKGRAIFRELKGLLALEEVRDGALL